MVNNFYQIGFIQLIWIIVHLQICQVLKCFHVSLIVESDVDLPEEMHFWLETRSGDIPVLCSDRGAKRVPHCSSKDFSDIFDDDNEDNDFKVCNKYVFRIAFTFLLFQVSLKWIL